VEKEAKVARKTIEIDERIGNDRVGLMITRGQVEHLGHAALKAQMMLDNSRNIIGFGSSQKSHQFGNPLTSDQKKRAQQGAWGDAFSIVFLEDIGATDRSTDWADYVFDRIRTHQLREPTDFYAGSVHEARWYEEHFCPMDKPATATRGLFQVWENEETNKRIHILDRKSNLAISSSEVRTLIERRDEAWKNFVPAKLWDFYDWEYPPELRDAIKLSANGPSSWPVEGYPGDKLPTGTKGIPEGSDEVMVLRADGRWRPRTDADNAKSMGD
jgi:nicotinamide mononucleotide adenylyltransferase